MIHFYVFTRDDGSCGVGNEFLVISREAKEVIQKDYARKDFSLCYVITMSPTGNNTTMPDVLPMDRTLVEEGA